MHRDKGRASCPGKRALIYQVLYPSSEEESKWQRGPQCFPLAEAVLTWHPKAEYGARAASSRVPGWETAESRVEESW